MAGQWGQQEGEWWKGRPQRQVGSDHTAVKEGPAKDFEAHPKKQKAVERFLAEEYHDLISVECDLAF